MDLLGSLVKKRSEDKDTNNQDIASLGRFSSRVSKLRGEGPMATSEEPEVALEVVSINIKDIEIPANYARKSVGDINPLVASIRLYGIQQPLKVIKLKGSKKYRLVFGRRRLQAAEVAGLDAVPCIVELAVKEDRLQMLSLVENLHRTSLHPLEESGAYQEMGQHISLEELSKNLGIAQEIIQAMTEFVNLPANSKKEMANRTDPIPASMLSVMASAFRKSKTHGKKLLCAIASGEISSLSQAEAYLAKL